MDRDWERLPFVPLDLAGAARHFPGRRVAAMAPLPGGRRNSHHRVELDGGEVLVLRRYADPASVALEAALHRRLADVVPLAPLVDAGEDFLILGLVDGAPCQNPTPALLAELGRVLAAIHAHAFTSIGFLDPELRVVTPLPPLPEVLRTLLAGAAERLGARAPALERLIQAHATPLAELDRSPVLVHGDFRPANVLVREGRLAAIIDWEFAMAGHALADLGQWMRDSPAIDALAAAQGDLPADWRRLARLCDLANLFQMLAVPDRPKQHAGALALVDETLLALAA